MSAPEELLAFQIKAAKLPEPEREVMLIPGRRFRWDFVWRGKYSLEKDTFHVGVAAEVQGGIWRKGAHSSGAGVTRDCEKANLAALQGFRTMFFTSDMVRDGRALQWLETALGGLA